jgi:hypothetical protein
MSSIVVVVCYDKQRLQVPVLHRCLCDVARDSHVFWILRHVMLQQTRAALEIQLFDEFPHPVRQILINMRIPA